jgi:hypothetical protein
MPKFAKNQQLGPSYSQVIQIRGMRVWRGNEKGRAGPLKT